MDQQGWCERGLKLSFWDYWLERKALPVYRGNFVEDVHTLPLGDWERLGGRGAYLSLANQQVTNGYVVEIAPGGEIETRAARVREDHVRPARGFELPFSRFVHALSCPPTAAGVVVLRVPDRSFELSPDPAEWA